MDVSTEILWEGPGWYAGSIEMGVDKWVRILDFEKYHSTATREARYKGLGTPRQLDSLEGFDKVKTPV